MSSAVAGALPIGDGSPTGADVDTGADGDGDAEATGNTVVVAWSLTSTSAMRSPVQFRVRHSWKSGDGSFGVYWLGKNPITV